ncbi:glycerophosphodiester phosphodiesterase [Nonomuraea sp. NPDC002799]
MLRRFALVIVTALSLSPIASPASATTATSVSSPATVTNVAERDTTATKVAPRNTTGSVTNLAHRGAAAGVINVAHRGASAYAPENTLAAFGLAADQRADMFELDVQETKDHELILMHDTTLTRTTDVERVFPDLSPWNTGDLTLAQVRKLDAGSWHSGDYTGEPVPTLGEALREMGGSGLGLLLEVKSPELYPGIEARIADELRNNPGWLRPGRVVVQSFAWDAMRRFHRLLPNVPIGLLGTPTSAQLPELASFADLVNPQHTTLTASYVRRVHGLGLRLLAWTVDDSSDMRRMLGYRVDGIITNRPDVLSGLLGA